LEFLASVSTRGLPSVGPFSSRTVIPMLMASCSASESLAYDD
jgi:hypothetical protein